MNTHRPYRSWCKFCVMGRGVKSPHRKSDGRDVLEGVHHVSMVLSFFQPGDSVLFGPTPFSLVVKHTKTRKLF